MNRARSCFLSCISALLLAVNAGAQQPSVTAVTPAVGPDNVALGVTIEGSGFVSGSRAALLNGGPHIISNLDTTSPGSAAEKVVVEGNYAYVADFRGGLKIIDIADPSAPFLAGTYGAGLDYAVDVSVRTAQQDNRTYAYVTFSVDSGGSRLDMVDVTDASAPAFKLSWSWPNKEPWSVVAADNGYVYFTDYSYLNTGHVRWENNAPVEFVFDNADVVPAWIGYSALTYDVFVDGDYAYVASFQAQEGGLYVFSLAVPANPVYLNRRLLNAPSGGVYDVHVAGNYAFLASAHEGLKVLDISNKDPLAIPNWLIYQLPLAGLVKDVWVDGGHAYLAGEFGLYVVDVADPARPVLAGHASSLYYGQGVYAVGGYAYLADHQAGLSVYDVSCPFAPAPQGRTIDTPSSAMDVVVSGNYAYVADGYADLQYHANLRVIDLGADPPLVYSPAATPAGTTAHDVVVRNEHAYVADQTFGLAIYDVSNPTAPQALGYTYLRGWTDGVDVDATEQYAYLADSYQGLVVVDVSDPALPVASAPYHPTGFSSYNGASGIQVVGTRAFLSHRVYGLWIIDVTAPSAPAFIGSLVGPAYGEPRVTGEAVFVAGNYAYVAYSDPNPSSADGGVLVIDVADPANPVTVGAYKIAVPSTLPKPVSLDVQVSGDYAYLACGSNGIHVVDVSDKSAPRLVGVYGTEDDARGVFVDGGKIYAATNYTGVKVMQVNPAVAAETLVSATTLAAVFPAGLPQGCFDVSISNPAGETGILPNGYEVRSAGQFPDLAVFDLTAPGTALAGTPFNVAETTANQGLFSAAIGSTTAFYFSTDSLLDAGDIRLGDRGVPGLTPETGDAATTSLTLPAGTLAGTYSLIAVADDLGVVLEGYEGNNSASRAIVLPAELTVTTRTAPTSVTRGKSFSASDTTENQGPNNAGGSVTAYYLSANVTLDAGDLMLGQRSVPALIAGAGSSGSTSLTVTGSVSAGKYYLLAVADDGTVVPETNENNTRYKNLTVK